jgi:hypothetical protein
VPRDPRGQTCFIEIPARNRKHRLNGIDLIRLQAVSV